MSDARLAWTRPRRCVGAPAKLAAQGFARVT
jgi:hypothetical protein